MNNTLIMLLITLLLIGYSVYALVKSIRDSEPETTLDIKAFCIKLDKMLKQLKEGK